MVLAIFAGLAGLAAGFVVFLKTSPERFAALKRPFHGLERAFAAKFGFDEFYRELLLRPAYLLATVPGLDRPRGAWTAPSTASAVAAAGPPRPPA